MGIYIDMALLAIMLIFLIVSAKRGFLITLLEVLVFAIAVISAANLCKPAANSIYDTFIGPNMSPVIFLLLSIVLSLLLSVVAKWLNKICKLPLIGTANTVLGGVFGILKGLIAVYFIGIILLLLSANSKQNTSFYEAVNNSAIITIIQNHSVVPIG